VSAHDQNDIVEEMYRLEVLTECFLLHQQTLWSW
jgi:hypothetical protein